MRRRVCHLCLESDIPRMPKHAQCVAIRVTRLLSVSLLVAALACAGRTRTITLPTGLSYQVLAEGTGPAARSGQRVTIHETTTLRNGALIYTSRGGGPITFQLGANQVIAGVDEGVTGMRAGERRLLVVPPALSRRTAYPPNTPPDSTLIIDVELVKIAGDAR